MTQDHCCFLCRSQYGCINHGCTHHVETRQQEDADHRARRTHRDPTGNTAINNIEQARRPRRRR